ncbi:hypothetical protein KUTeg_002606 [Tegillarca granosa]|uniref:Uncharacterized protein n=1 Tax=Tegillarca granosa TaxID=220873 RepID=A0ABQ9FSA5_TEGGR|nr:hypothetical protein KUTeg_001725 [Tegillarca granosa]KAJ8321019.1 hypothetical protein KUTeg_002606 [Tegillarca granosa]
MLVVTNAQLQPGQGGQPGTNGQQFNSQCLAIFDQNFRKCFMTNGGFPLEVIFSIVTNGTSGPLPQGTNRQTAVQSICGNIQGIMKCVEPVPTSTSQTVTPKCTDREEMMMQSTVQSMTRALSGICGITPPMPPCLQKFDTKFKACMTQNNIPPDNFFKLLANTSEGTGMTLQQLKNSTCSAKVQQTIIQCASQSLQQINSECNQEQQFMVGQTLQNMMATYQSVCTGKPIQGGGMAPSPCVVKFEKELNTCAINNLKIDVPQLMMLLTKGKIPPGKDMSQLNKTICQNFHDFEDCGKNLIGKSGCKGKDLLITEGTFANMVITVGAYCHDTSVPGACMLTLQSQFTQCFVSSGLDPKMYFSNQTAHKGALLGTTRPMAEKYCSKRHVLYECMKRVMHQCPGAEETMTLTGFDLTAMERAVAILCADIPDYLTGIECFEVPSKEAKSCMAAMGRSITTLSAKQMTNGLSMDSFFKDFCECDTSAWPTCKKKAIDLKRKFECHLLPSRCHQINEDKIRQICPEEALVQPDKCITGLRDELGTCLAKYNIDPEVFLVNVTHDRTNILGSKARANMFCTEKEQVFSCMRRKLESCPGSKEMLEHWGHQQNQLESAINLLCKEMNVYDKGLTCLPSAQSSINTCIKESEGRMLQLQAKEDATKIIRLEHLKCDLNAVKPSCDQAVVGLKTEFECNIIQDRCKGFQRSEVNKICNENNYARAERLQVNNDNNGAVTMTTMSLFGSIMTSLFAIFISLL